MNSRRLIGQSHSTWDTYQSECEMITIKPSHYHHVPIQIGHTAGDPNYRCATWCAIVMTTTFALTLALLIVYSRRIVNVHGTYIAASVQQSANGYFVRCQYNVTEWQPSAVTEFNTTNCFRDDVSRTYRTYQHAERNAHSSCINHTIFEFDLRHQSCYDDVNECHLLCGLVVLRMIALLTCAISIASWCALLELYCKNR